MKGRCVCKLKVTMLLCRDLPKTCPDHLYTTALNSIFAALKIKTL